MPVIFPFSLLQCQATLVCDLLSVYSVHTKMNTAVQLFEGQLSLITTPIPKVSDPNDIVIKVSHCGVCGTDLHIVAGEFPAAKKLIMGHEFAGVVSEIGSAVHHVRVGDR